MIVLPILLLLAGLFAGEQTPTALVLVVLRHVVVRIPRLFHAHVSIHRFTLSAHVGCLVPTTVRVH
jgi:hypothetical protein